MKLYKGGKLYNSKVDQWEAIKITISEIEQTEVKKKKIVKSMYNKLLVVIEKRRRCIKI